MDAEDRVKDHELDQFSKRCSANLFDTHVTDTINLLL